MIRVYKDILILINIYETHTMKSFTSVVIKMENIELWCSKQMISYKPCGLVYTNNS